MAEYTDVGLFFVQPRSCFHCQHPAREQDVADSNRHSGATDHAHAREPALFKLIDIAGDGNDRSDPLELTDYMEVADITGVQDGCDTREMLNDRLIKPTMSIGDDADVRRPLEITVPQRVKLRAHPVHHSTET